MPHDNDSLKQYLDERLHPDQAHELEGKLLDDHLQRVALEGLQKAREQGVSLDAAARQMAGDWQATHTTGPTPTARPWLSWAAILLVLVLAGIAALQYHRYRLPDRLVEQYLPQVYDASLVLRSTVNEAVHPELTAAARAEAQKAYAESLPHFLNYLEVEPEDFEMTMRAGVDAIRAGEDAVAKQLFRRARFNSDLYFAQATLGLALAHLQAREFTTTQTLLQELTQGDHSLSISARALNEQLLAVAKK